jgi:hypothetical protein
VWGSEFTTKPLNYRGIQQNSCQPFSFVLRALDEFVPAFSFPRKYGQKSSPSGDACTNAYHARLEVEEHRAVHVLAARGLVVSTLMRPSQV